MTFIEKINNVALQLNDLHIKLYAIDENLLIYKEDKAELAKLKELHAFYSASILEFVMEGNQEFVRFNKDIVKDVIKEAEYFIKTVNSSI